VQMNQFLALICCVCIVVVCVEGLQMKPLNRPNTLRARRVDINPDPVPASTTFDFYLFVQQWDATITTDFFTIHGLWPENEDGSYPSNCPGPQFNTTAITDLISEMNVVWPSNSGSNSDFWTHEWEKHGTCSQFGEHDFFQNVVTLQDRYNVKAALSSAGIVPSQSATYAKTSLASAVKAGLGANPALHCSSSRLLEVALCITKNLALMDCPTSLGSYFACPKSITYY